MARSDRHNRNLAKVKSMLDGTFERHKVQVGQYNGDVHANRKVGERYFDHDDKEWEKTEWGRKSISKLADRGIADKCSDCEKLIFKKFYKDTYNRMGICYNCQVHFEQELKWNPKNKIGRDNNKWFFWVKLQELLRWEAIDKDIEQLVENNYQENKKNPFDKSIVNALANENLEMSIKQNNA